VRNVPTVQVEDIAVYYELHGAGEPLVLIGGLGADSTLFAGMVERLALNHRVLTFDNRGAGRTDKPDAPYSIVGMAEDTAGLMDALSIDRAHVLGISMGGRIALELAMAHPDRVAKLVLVSTSAAGRGKLSLSWPMRMMLLLKAMGIVRGEHPQPRYAYLRQRDASVTYNGLDRLGQIRAPALVLHGRQDRSMPLEAAERMRQGIAGSRMEVFEGGHMFFVFSRRNEFLDRVEHFLAE
jgi:3-oxoadipate enol-lactonase